MTVRFKCQSEYQKSYRVSRSRSVSPQRCAPLAGLRSDQMGISREPGLQRRKRFSPGGLAQSCSSLLFPPDLQHSLTEPTSHAHRTAPSAASRSRLAYRKEPFLDPKRPTPSPSHLGSAAEPQTPAAPRPAADPGPPSGPLPAADPGPPSGPRPAADPGPPSGPRPAAEPGPTIEPGSAGKSVSSAKPHPSKPDSQPGQSQPLTAAPNGQQPSANEVQHAAQWRAVLRAGLRAGGQRSEYNRQFSWKKPAAAASPILTAEQVLHSNSRSVPPFKKNPVSVETEYRRSFQGLVSPTGPRLRKQLEHQRVPLFHTHVTNKKRRKPRPKPNVPAPQTEDVTPLSPPHMQRGHRMLTEYESSFRSPLCRIPEGGGATEGDAEQVKELRQKALSYRRRAWGAHFSRDHLSQLLSEHNALWEATDTTTTDPPTPRLTSDLCRDTDSRSPVHVEALDLDSRSSKKSSVVGSGEIHPTNRNTQPTPPSPAEGRLAWGQEEEEEENTDEEEGRLPTPRLKMLPVQRTHHDLTTPAAGGAILVGKLQNSDESPYKQQRCGSDVSMAAGAETADVLVKQKMAWPENNSSHRPRSSGPSPGHKPASKPIRMKQTPPSLAAPPPQHCIHGNLRHPDFQHNGELGLRFRELQCSGGGCGSDEDDRLSVMSWRSAASCSMASAVLERAQKRRENFWGKR